jgi:hypothetical protein
MEQDLKPHSAVRNFAAAWELDVPSGLMSGECESMFMLYPGINPGP